MQCQTLSCFQERRIGQPIISSTQVGLRLWSTRRLRSTEPSPMIHSQSESRCNRYSSETGIRSSLDHYQSSLARTNSCWNLDGRRHKPGCLNNCADMVLLPLFLFLLLFLLGHLGNLTSTTSYTKKLCAFWQSAKKNMMMEFERWFWRPGSLLNAVP